MGNGVSKIFVILEKESNNSLINITESTSGTVLFEGNSTDKEVLHPYTDLITNIITISNYNKEIERCINSKDKKEMKDFMLRNSTYNTELELYEFEYIQAEEKEWYYNNLKLRIQELINNSRRMFNSIRKSFVLTKDIDTGSQPNISMQRQYTCASKNGPVDELLLYQDHVVSYQDHVVSYQDPMVIPPSPVLRRH
jgi:hypothetical protein